MRPDPHSATRTTVATLLCALGAAALLSWCSEAHAQSVFRDGFESPKEPGAPVCEPIPAGFRVVEMPWNHIMYGYTWPNTPSHLVPLGGWTLGCSWSAVLNACRTPRRSKPVAGVLLTTSFVIDGNRYKFGWVGAQGIAAAGYFLPMAADRFTIIVSECRADITAPCQATAASGNMFYGKGVANPSCRFNPGKKLWITWHFAQPDFDPTTNTCTPTNYSGGSYCEMNVQQQSFITMPQGAWTWHAPMALP